MVSHLCLCLLEFAEKKSEPVRVSPKTKELFVSLFRENTVTSHNPFWITPEFKTENFFEVTMQRKGAQRLRAKFLINNFLFCCSDDQNVESTKPIWLQTMDTFLTILSIFGLITNLVTLAAFARSRKTFSRSVRIFFQVGGEDILIFLKGFPPV